MSPMLFMYLNSLTKLKFYFFKIMILNSNCEWHLNVFKCFNKQTKYIQEEPKYQLKTTKM